MSPIVKKKGEKFTLPGKYLLFILTILCTAMVLLTFNTKVFSGPLSAVAGYIVVPFEEGISVVEAGCQAVLKSLSRSESFLPRMNSSDSGWMS